MGHIADLIAGIRASQSEISLSLARGNASTWEAYQRMVGQYQGLEQALEILNNILKEPDDDEEKLESFQAFFEKRN
jgi:CRISPR/Cas system CSM-associated protein Csm2 small subunit